MIYWLYLVVLLLLLAFERNATKKLRRIIRILIPVLYSFLVGFRGYYVGVDTHNYVDGFYAGREWGLGFVEPGFDWINIQIYKMGCEAHVDLWVYAAITFVFFYLTLERLEKKYYTIAAFFLYFMTFNVLCNGMRQSVACGALLYSFRFIEEKKPWLYVGIMATSSLIHASALFTIPLYLLRYIKISRPQIIWGIYIVSFVGVFMDISSLIPAIELGNRGYGMDGISTQEASWLGFCITTILHIIVLINLTKTVNSMKYPILYLFILLSYIFTNLAYNMPYLTRMTMYFSWFEYLAYPYLYHDKEAAPPFSKQTWLAIFLVLKLTTFVNTRIKYENEYYMYWQKQPAGIKIPAR